MAILAVPVWKFVNANDSETLSAMGVFVDNKDAPDEPLSFTQNPLHIVFFALTVLVSGYLIYVILQFENRKQQMKLAYIGMIALMLEILSMVKLTQTLPLRLGAGESKYAVGFFFPIVAILLVYLAARFIKKDEDLVRSVNRVR